MKAFSLEMAVQQPRTLGIRIQLEVKCRDLNASQFQQLQEALSKHGVVCVVNQPLIPRDLYDFAARWGEVIELPPALALSNPEPGFPSITRVGNIRPDGSIIPSVRFAEYWHHDGDFWMPGQNYIVNFLNSVRVPERGGNTGFLDTQKACESLSPAELAQLKGAYIWVRASEISDFKKAAPKDLPPDAQHPVLLPHPRSKKLALYLPDSPTGMQNADGQVIGSVETWVESAVKKLGIYEHAWTPGDLVLMDNLQVMHRGMGGYADSPRLLYRCQARLSTRA